MSVQSLKIKFFTQPKYTRKIFEIVSGFLELIIENKQAYREFMVALGEAVDNAIMHGNQLVATKYIEIDCEIAPDRVTCNVQDEGKGFNCEKFLKDPLTNFTPEALMKKVSQFGTPGSMGIAMMRKCLNEVKYNERGNCLTLVKYLGEALTKRTGTAD